MFAYSFLSMTAHNVIKPISRSKFITDLGADNLPYVQFGAALIIGVLMYFYARASNRLPRRWVMPLTQAGLVVVMVVFWLLFPTGQRWVSVALYVFNFMLGILLASQFWTLANDLYDSRQARRLFGFIGAGACLGGAVGSLVTKFSVNEVGTDNLALVSAALMAACAVVVTTIIRRQSASVAGLAVESERGVGAGEAIRLLIESRHLRLIAIVIAFAQIGAVLVEQQFYLAAEAAKGASGTDAITEFLAGVGFYVSAAGFVVQIALTSRVHRTLGLIFALLLLPVTLGSTAVVILLNAALWATSIARVVDSSLRYSIDKTTREVLFLPLPADLKHRAKPFVDVTVDRSAKALGALLVLVMIKPWGLNLAWWQLSYASLVIVGLWVGVALVARREYLRTFRQSIGARDVEPATVRVDVADPATIQTLVSELSSPDEASVVYAVEMLEVLGKRSLVTPLLLHHAAPKVRARTLVMLASAPPDAAEAGHWMPAVQRLLRDDDADVRAAAVRALAALRHEAAPAVMREFLDDANPRVAVTAAVALADTGNPADARAAEHALVERINDTRAVAAGTRRDVAAGLARIRNPAFRSLLIPLIHDPAVDVALEAVRSARRLEGDHALFVPALVSLLGHRALKAAARDALVSFGDDVVPLLAHVLRDGDEQAWVRRHVPATLARLPTPPSVEALVASLDDPDGFLRYKVVEALEAIRRDHPQIASPSRVADRLVMKESARYCRLLTLRVQLGAQSAASGTSLLSRALDDKLTRSLDRLYRLLALIHPWQDVADARYSIEHGDGRARAAAVEYLDGLLSAHVRRRVIPLIDESPVDDKVIHAHAHLRTRPRDLADTVAQLVHEDDPVVAAAAIWFVEEHRLWALSGDLEHVLAHPPAMSSLVADAAAHALAASDQTSDDARIEISAAVWPVVRVVDRLRSIPLFAFVSIDELFRFAGAGEQVRYDRGRELSTAGAPADTVLFLLEGSVSAVNDAPLTVIAPAALHFEEMLEGRSVRHTTIATSTAVCLRLKSADALTMIADNVALAQGLFRMLLASSLGRAEALVRSPISVKPIDGRASRSFDQVEKAIRLRQSPWLARATVTQLLDLVAIARAVPLATGRVLLGELDRPALYHVLEGEVRVERNGSPAETLGSGATLGIAETLAGIPSQVRAVVTVNGHALRLDREDLFDVLVNHVDLLQGVFSGVLNAKARADRQ